MSAQLTCLAVNQWLQRLTDYVHIKSVKPVPDHVTDYVCFTRWNPKSQQRRLKQLDRRTAHLAQKHGVAESEMRAQLLTSIENHAENSQLPFIHVQSLSTPADNHQRHKFLLFIQCDKHLTKTRHTNTFTCYGLSQREEEQQTLVPWF
ncbi:type I-F CRISPR-associated endoribonuclease Cas6/Csy4 [Vibrio sp. PP-XX7]